jgi:hypothetical protein
MIDALNIPFTIAIATVIIFIYLSYSILFKKSSNNSSNQNENTDNSEKGNLLDIQIINHILF